MKRFLSMSMVMVLLLGVLMACGTETPTSGPSATSATGGSTGAALPSSITIASSLPRTGSSKGQTDTIVNAIKMRLEEDANAICGGKVKVNYEDMDDATAAKGSWDEAKEAENANKAAANKDVMVYIGTFNSGAAKISIPILNQADLVMISPANTNPGLTKPGKGNPGEPEIYYPKKTRNYTRVVPADDIQGAAAANWAKELGVTKAYILHDNEVYGKGVADVFSAKAKELGIAILGTDGIDAKASDYKSLMTKIKDLGPELIYFGGITQNNAGQVIKDMRAVGMTADAVKFMGPDGIYEQAFLDAAGAENAEGVYVTFGGVPPGKLEGKGADWYKRYKEKFGSEPEAYAAYGYESAGVALAGLNASCSDLTRANVLKNVFAIKDYDGVLGKWSFDANGDTSLTQMSGQVVKGGVFEFVQVLK